MATNKILQAHDIVEFLCSVALLTWAFVWLACLDKQWFATQPRWLLWAPVLVVDGAIVLLLILAALKRTKYIPNRFPALLIVPVMYVTLVTGFAAIYLHTGAIARRSLGSPMDSGANARVDTPGEAFYFSFLTMITYGSDFGPASPQGQRVIMAEFGSGLLFLLMAFPILASRLALFDETETMSNTTKKIAIEKKPGGDWKITITETTVLDSEGLSNAEAVEVDLTTGKVEEKKQAP